MSTSRRFHTGERIPDSGIYRVFHGSHRLPHEVTLLDGETFPHCLKCDNAVEFQLLRRAPNIQKENAFRVVLFGLPPTEDATGPMLVTRDSHQEQHVATDEKPPPEQSKQFEHASPSVTPLATFRFGEKKETDQIFRPGDEVPEDGIYGVEHDSHRLLHQATLAKGIRFPRCRRCRDVVRFRFVRRVGHKYVPVISSNWILEEWDETSPPAKVG